MGQPRRRFTALVLAVAVLGAAGCAGGDEDGATTTQDSTTTSVAAATTDPPATTDGASAPGGWGGDYRIFGRNPDGSRYHGELTIEGDDDGALALDWDTNGTYQGVGVTDGDTLASTHGDEADQCHAAAYRIGVDGRLAARWVSADGRGPTTEAAAPVVPGPPGVAGTYAIEGVNADGQSYRGSMDVVATGAAFEVTRQVGGILVQGSALQLGDVLAVGFGDETCAVVAYRQRPDGLLDGIWGAARVQNPGTERATPR